MRKTTTDAGATSTVMANAAVPAASRSIVFIDGGVDDWQGLVAQLEGEPHLVLLDPGQDGVGQMSEALAACRDLAAVHIIAHGVPGCLHLGSASLSLATLYCYANRLAGWRSALGPKADILIHSREVGAGTDGEALLRRLRDLTGADRAAATTEPGLLPLHGPGAGATRQ